ncbi:MAG: hypothetical protein J0M00_14735 [Burkholderiales bacterium]|nr:hypothetical protein [Burkholderiales bacterium]
MADNKDGQGFFRKMVRFVANPATDWAELGSRQEDTRELELEKSELKAMVERKRRNDFVRKREFDMLRKVRREGLTPDQLGTLGRSSRLDDSEARPSDNASARPEGGVKAKIDEIEQQMVGNSGFAPSERRNTGFSNAPTEPAVLARSGLPPPSGSAPLDAQRDVLPALPPLPDLDLRADEPPAPVFNAPGLPPLAPLSLATTGDTGEFEHRFGVEVSEVVHDPELDEAVIAFANADFTQCEQSLSQITGAGGARAQHAETWLVLFDLYRATGQQQRFEQLAGDYAHQFGWSAPQWFSLPKLVSDAVADAAQHERSSSGTMAGDVGWVCPEVLDLEAVARLRSQTLQMPLPWVFDWSGLRHVEPEAATQLSSLFRHWSKQQLEMRWMSGENLFATLQEAAPTGVRDADPAYWQARLDALRLANRADQFDEAAIDYCVTYEVSPPSWEHTRCNVRISGSGMNTHTPPLSMVSEVSTGFMESGLIEDAATGTQVASIELSGQLVGDISETLNRLNGQLGQASLVSVSCAKLIRVDFIAAGDLLNWVLVKRGEKRMVHFVDAHRLVALFFGAMGINEHARVQVRKV